MAHHPPIKAALERPASRPRRKCASIEGEPNFGFRTFNERETASVLANSLWATLQGGRDIEATSPQPHVDYLAETALRISFFTFLVSTFGTAFTVLFGWRSDREFKLKIVQLEAQVTEWKRQGLKDKTGASRPLD